MNEEQKNECLELLKEAKNILVELRDAALPFISGDIVDETSGTISLMKSLGEKIEKVDEFIGN